MNITIITGKGGGDLLAIIDAMKKGFLDNIFLKKIYTRNNIFLKYHNNFSVEKIKINKNNKNTVLRKIYDELLLLNCDLIILAGFEFILPSYFFNSFKYKILNSHHSILPANKGLFKKEKIVNSDQKLLGFTLHYIDEKIDSGKIMTQACFPNYEINNFEKILSIYRFVADVMLIQFLREQLKCTNKKRLYSYMDIIFSPSIEKEILDYFYIKHFKQEDYE